ncbi:uncharacterized protein LOC106157235 [Lingula anatina]|uniref:Uncharacterized protein LOC106157235 n=1 Tax=Lingula anatina TaxID=7574 RepID=A0A1S3HQG7_LINAN|nr:uncharacterized protein LOC106157235 [Lingula anatina]|eukprot:XP_013388280.1 uncharacterized protein LOC106157235 [Lingula anatina]
MFLVPGISVTFQRKEHALILKIYDEGSKLLAQRERIKLNNLVEKTTQWLNAPAAAFPKLAKPDVQFYLIYLQIEDSLYHDEIEKAKMLLDTMDGIIPHTSDRNYFEISKMIPALHYTVRATPYLKEDFVNSALRAVRVSEQLLKGRTAGWINMCVGLYRARKLWETDQSENPETFKILEDECHNCFNHALEDFSAEEGIDGPHGYNNTSIRKALLHLSCDSVTMRNIPSSFEDIKAAENLLHKVENSDYGVPGLLEPYYKLALSDLCYRQRRYERSRQYAHAAQDIAHRNKMTELEARAKKRLEHLQQFCGASESDELNDILKG